MIILSKFSETLNELMFERNILTGKRLADELGLPAPTVTRYLNSKHTPRVEHLILIADYFNCSVDYLLGLENSNSSTVFKPCPPFSEQIVFLAKHFKKSCYAFYRETGISESSFFEWKNGTSMPTLESLNKIVEYFGCSFDFVLGRE